MNMLPAVIAYLDERLTTLAMCQIRYETTVRELKSVKSLCEGLQKQFEIMDRMLSGASEGSDHHNTAPTLSKCTGGPAALNYGRLEDKP